MKLLSIVIPAYNRIEPLKITLKSVNNALKRFDQPSEVIVVDDGSKAPLQQQLSDFEIGIPLQFIRQENQGSIIARMTGLESAKGKYTIFLDSDDVLHKDKISKQIEAMEVTAAEVSYTDQASVNLDEIKDLNNLPLYDFSLKRMADSPPDFYLKVQPAPNCPIYQTVYLKKHLLHPIIKPERKFDSVGDVWIYFNLASFPAKIIKVDGYYSIYGNHEEDRYTDHWEILGVSSTEITVLLLINLPETKYTNEVKKIISQNVFVGWRKHPKGYSLREQDKLLLELWKLTGKETPDMGGQWFDKIAKVVGPVNAGKMAKFRGVPYRRIKTIDAQTLQELKGRIKVIREKLYE